MGRWLSLLESDGTNRILSLKGGNLEEATREKRALRRRRVLRVEEEQVLDEKGQI